MKIDDLRARLEELNAQCQDIRLLAEAEKRDLTAEEENTLRDKLNEFDRVSARIADLTRLEGQSAALTGGTGRKTDPAAPTATPPSAPVEPAALATRNDGPKVYIPNKGASNGGFRNLGEMAWHIRNAAVTKGTRIDSRLEALASASTYGNEASGSDGGFSVPPDFRNSIMETVLGEDSLLNRCDTVTVAGNSFTCPMDETTPWQTSGGVLAYWDGEAAAATQSKPQLQERTIRLNKCRALVPVTEELLEDSSAMDTYLRRKAPLKIAFKVALAIVQGTGTGQPLGILNSPCLVTAAAEGGQTADTLVGANVLKMYSRMYAPSRSKAVWLMNQDVEPQLLKLSIPGTDNAGNAVTGWGTTVYMPPGGLSASPYGTLLGRPIVSTQACETIGDVGDLIFADLSQYLVILKGGPNPRVETSMHLWFDQDLVAFKFVLRVGGMPWWSTTVSARDGSATYSPFVALAAR